MINLFTLAFSAPPDLTLGAAPCFEAAFCGFDAVAGAALLFAVLALEGFSGIGT